MSSESQLFGCVGPTNMSVYMKQLYANYFAIKSYLVFKGNLSKMFQKSLVFLLQWKEMIAFHKKSS